MENMKGFIAYISAVTLLLGFGSMATAGTMLNDLVAVLHGKEVAADFGPAALLIFGSGLLGVSCCMRRFSR